MMGFCGNGRCMVLHPVAASDRKLGFEFSGTTPYQTMCFGTFIQPVAHLPGEQALSVQWLGPRPTGFPAFVLMGRSSCGNMA